MHAISSIARKLGAPMGAIVSVIGAEAPHRREVAPLPSACTDPAFWPDGGGTEHAQGICAEKQ